MNDRYDILKVEEYEDSNGEVKARFYNVGTAFDNQNGGQTLYIPEGISLTGKVITKRRKDKEANAG